MNSYPRSTSQRNDCIYDCGCNVDAVDPQLQRHWPAASRNIDKAQTLIGKLDPATMTAAESN